MESLGFEPIGPISGVRPALAVISYVAMDAALLAVRVDDDLSVQLAQALDDHTIPYALVAAIPALVEAQPRMREKPLVQKPLRAAGIAAALRLCGLTIPAGNLRP